MAEGEDDARTEGRAALKERPFDSVKKAFKFFGLSSTTFAFIGAALGYFQQLNGHGVVALAVAAATTLPIGLTIFEVERLSRCRRALRDLLRAERNYEDLLRDARTERDAAKRERDEAVISGTAVAAAQQEALRMLAAGGIAIQPDPVGEEGRTSSPAPAQVKR